MLQVDIWLYFIGVDFNGFLEVDHCFLTLISLTQNFCETVVRLSIGRVSLDQLLVQVNGLSTLLCFSQRLCEIIDEY